MKGCYTDLFDLYNPLTFFPVNSSCKEFIKMKLCSQVMVGSLPERNVIFLVTNILKCRYIIGLVKKFRFPFTKAKSIESNSSFR